MGKQSFSYGGRAFSYGAKTAIGAGMNKPQKIDGDIVEENSSYEKHSNGVVNLKPLQPLIGQTIRGVNVRMNNNIIKPFSTPKLQRNLPLSSETLNPQNSPAIAHLGKAIGSSKSLVKNIGGLFRGRGVESKNNIRLVL